MDSAKKYTWFISECIGSREECYIGRYHNLLLSWKSPCHLVEISNLLSHFLFKSTPLKAPLYKPKGKECPFDYVYVPSIANETAYALWDTRNGCKVDLGDS